MPVSWARMCWSRMLKRNHNIFWLCMGMAGIFLACPVAGVFAQGKDLSTEPAIDAKPQGGAFPMIDIKKMDKKVEQVELQADKVSFSSAENKASAQGNVVVKSGKDMLYCDQLELDRGRQEGAARGHVYIDGAQGQIDADEAQYNFAQGTGEFTNARIFNDPYQIKGRKVYKLSATHMASEDGYMTTCDHDEPHFRLQTKRMDIYQGDKAVAQGVKMYLGKVPVMYIPKYTQNLKDKPWLMIIPGKTKEFGAFLLTTMRMKVSDNSKLIIHVDYRERKDLASGFDYKYDTAHYGSGILKTYYTNERPITSKHTWNPRPSPTPEHERFRVDWRHKWQPDSVTDILTQYSRVSDPTFLKEYFERQYRNDPSTDTYFLLTRAIPKGTLSFRIDASRVNRFNRGVERFPEVKYEISNQEIGATKFYLRSANTFSNLVLKDNPVTESKKTMRLDTDNAISRPFKVAFIEVNPFVGGEQTYYSRSNDLKERNLVRTAFKTGTSLSTKFMRVWNYKKELFGMKIDKLRHIITPGISYAYTHDPSISPAHLNSFDGIDGLRQQHNLNLSLVNKLQTKRGKEAVDILRTTVESQYELLQDEPGNGMGPVKSTVEFLPSDWLTLKFDETYDHKNNRWSDSGFEAYINGGQKWSLNVSRRFTFDVDDQYTTELIYKINPKWKIKMYDRFTVDKGVLKEEDYVLTRDLHEWEMDLMYHQIRGGGTDLFIVFRLKAFPEMDLDLFSSGFNKRKAGSQSGD